MSSPFTSVSPGPWRSPTAAGRQPPPGAAIRVRPGRAHPGPDWHQEEDCPARATARAYARLHAVAHGVTAAGCGRAACARLAAVVVPEDYLQGPGLAHRADQCPAQALARAYARLHHEAHGPVSGCARLPCAGFASATAPAGHAAQALPRAPDPSG